MKVLFVVPRFPFPANSGADIAAHETLLSLRELCEIHILTPPPESEPEANLQSLGRSLPEMPVHFYPRREPQVRWQAYMTAALTMLTGESFHSAAWRNKALTRATRELVRREAFDVVHCEWLNTAASVTNVAAPVLVRTLDVHHVGLSDWISTLPDSGRLKRAFWEMQHGRFKQFETSRLSAAPVVVTLSLEDETSLRDAGVINVITIPPPMRLPVERRPVACASGSTINILFTGRLDMSVNREAFFTFSESIWPGVERVSRRRAAVVFAGGFPDDAIRDRASKSGIELRENLSDDGIFELFDNADVCISPVNFGTGIKVKTLQAMSRGKPMIGFPNSFRGVPVVHGEHALIARSPEEFAAMLCELIDDNGLRSRLGAGARDLVDSHFNPGRLGARLAGAYAGLM